MKQGGEFELFELFGVVNPPLLQTASRGPTPPHANPHPLPLRLTTVRISVPSSTYRLHTLFLVSRTPRYLRLLQVFSLASNDSSLYIAMPSSNTRFKGFKDPANARNRR